mmetsp:Transcript_19816/g.41365  ORF Transcript_19816/g.41365 Transcript_19816/m.41365 type:complete len:173 (-) Transcript_19816:14-532(-)
MFTPSLQIEDDQYSFFAGDDPFVDINLLGGGADLSRALDSGGDKNLESYSYSYTEESTASPTTPILTPSPTTSPPTISPTTAAPTADKNGIVDQIPGGKAGAMGAIVFIVLTGAFITFCVCMFRSKGRQREKKRMQAQMELQTFNRMAETSSFAYAKPAGSRMQGIGGGGFL